MYKSFHIKKKKGFTLVELMIIMAIMAILMAAFAPIYTARMKASISGGGGVWNYLESDNNYNAIARGKSTFFIGMGPQNEAAYNAISNKSVLNVSTSNSLRSGQVQSQMQFRFGNNETGSIVGALEMDTNGNVLLGGPWDKLDKNTLANTVVGARAARFLDHNGNNNVAVGAMASFEVNHPNRTTTIGHAAGWARSDDDVLIGYGATGPDSNGGRNTLIGGYKGSELNFQSSSGSKDNTIIAPYNGKTRNKLGNFNTAVGQGALTGDGSYNTAIGLWALNANGVGDYNTGVGTNSGSFANATIGDNKTFIGQRSKDVADSIYSDDVDRVFIGGEPSTGSVGTGTGMAILEVHNSKSGTNSSLKPISGIGDESVIVNGDLIIRGQTFVGTEKVGTPIYSTSYLPDGSYGYDFTSLVGLKREKPSDGQAGIVCGLDGTRSDTEVSDGCNICQRRGDLAARSVCACTMDGRSSTNSDANQGTLSYDWTSMIPESAYMSCMLTNHGFLVSNGWGYEDLSTGKLVTTPDRWFLNRAHNQEGKSCCPNILSDIRLKDLDTPFEGGLNEIEKLKVKNYTFISDKNKLPHVGVIAQDLAKIFPNAVKKSITGYLELRWDEIFYSAINAIKELDAKIHNLVVKIDNNKKRIEKLNKENAELEKQLDNLISEIEKLESK